MADRKASPGDTDPIAGSDDPRHAAPPPPPPAAVPDAEKHAEEHIEDAPASSSDSDSAPNLHKKGALGFIQQQHTIPTTGSVIPTGKWEYIFFCVYCKFLFTTASSWAKTVHSLTRAE